MWRFILAWIISTAVSLAASSDSPVGTWATQIVGKDHGICYLTFSNDMSVAGYGISLDALGPFNLLGNWNIDGKGRLVGGLTQFIPNGGFGALYRGKAHNDKLRVHVNSTAGGFNFKGEPANDIADLTGPWNAKVKRNGKPFFVAFNAVLSTNVPAWFELSGNGNNANGSFALSGGILITPDDRVAAYTVYDYGTSVETNAFVGKLVKRGKKLVLRGRTDNNQPAMFRAERAAP